MHHLPTSLQKAATHLPVLCAAPQHASPVALDINGNYTLQVRCAAALALGDKRPGLQTAAVGLQVAKAPCT